MRRRLPLLLMTRLAVGVLLAVATACSPGGGPGTPAPVPMAAPQNLAYATNPAVYTKGVAVPPNVPSHGGGTVSGYAISPALPAGLVLDPGTGSLTGTPGSVAPAASYTVIATNASGSTTAALSLMVNDVPPAHLSYGTPAATYTVGTTIPPNVVTHDGGAVTGYSLSPALPAGFVFNAVSAAITGTPSVPSALTTYTLTATNSGGSTTASLSIVVNAAAGVAPDFTTQPANLTLTEGQSGQFLVVVTGTPTPTLEWQYSVGNGPWTGFGVTTPTYAVSGVTLGDNGRRYRVAASNSAGTTYSNAATLTVNALLVAPAFTTQPGNASITEGQNAQFVVAVSGVPTPTLQWQVSTNSGSSWADLSGATNAMFDVLGATLSQNARQFRAVATNTSGSVPSQVAVLTVHAAQGAKAFGTATLIESGATGASRPRIAFAPNGDALAVWMQQSDGLYFHIWANRYTAATNTWGTEELLGPGAGDAWDPRIAIDLHGNALVVWYQDGDPTGAGRNDIWSNYYTAGTGWGGAMLVENDNAGPALSPQVAFDPSGVGVAVWLQSDGTASQIRSNRFTAGAWGTVTLLEAATPGASAGPQIAIDASGNALVVWSRYNGTANLAMANRYTVGTGWGAAEVIGSDTAFVGINQTQIASDGNGNAVAVWNQGGKIQANHFVPGSGWGTAALIEWTGGDANSPQVAFDANGNALAVWQQNTGFGTLTRIWSNRYTVGSGWGGFPALIQTDPNGGGVANALAPQIAMDASGDALAVWVQTDASSPMPNIWINRYTAGSGWGTTANLGQVRINIPGAAGSPAGWPQIAIDSNGNALVVWYQSDGTADSIWSNRYQ